MSKKRLLDTYCGAGGCSMGYYRAGFEVEGVDIKPQKHYPFEFHLGDAIEFILEYGHEYDVISASPPCQAFSVMTISQGERRKEHPDLIGATRQAILRHNQFYVIENVTGARSFLQAPVMLCGKSFGLKVYRHRWFECSPFILTPAHEQHRDSTPRAGRGVSPKGFISVSGGTGNLEYAKMAMGISWMTQRELSQAIPPAYTEWIGCRLLELL